MLLKHLSESSHFTKATYVGQFVKLEQDKGIPYPPFFSSKVPAGFPSPADDYLEFKLDLNEHLIKHPAATFFVRASGDSMKNAGIFSGDLLLVDRSVEPIHGNVVIAAMPRDYTNQDVNLDGG